MSMVEKFTSILYELSVKKDFSLKESLEIMSKNKESVNKKINKIADFLLNCIFQGESLSNSLKKNPFVKFDDVYITFITYGEKTGALRETIKYLNSRCSRQKENLNKVIEASIYPVFVIFIAVLLSLYLSKSELFSISGDIYFLLFCLSMVCIIIFFIIKKLIGENKTYEAFLGISFLLKSGINLYDSVCLGGRIVGSSSKKGLLFQKAGEKLLFGMDLQQSFSFERKYLNAFYYADKSGGKADIFEKIANWIGEEDEKKRRICFSLIEPVFILVTGVFLLILVSNLFMPYLSNISWI